MKIKITLIITLILVTLVFSSCTKKIISDPQIGGDEPLVEPDDTSGEAIGNVINNVDTVDQELNTDDVDVDLNNLEEDLNNW